MSQGGKRALEHDPLAFLASGGEMGERTRAFDWSKTALGPVARWPQSLKTVLRVMLDSRYPMFVWWGRELTNFYNDGYIPMLGKRHPDALGRSAAEVWSDVWPVVGPQTEAVLSEGRATWNEELLLVMERNGFTEEAYFTFSYSPVPDDEGGVGGVFCAVTEDTQRVLSQRRLRTLRALAEQAAQAKTAEEACEVAAATFAENPHDLPFTLLYLLDGNARRATLAGLSGLSRGLPTSPAAVELQSVADPWPFRQVAETGKAVEVHDLPKKFGPLPGGAWPESPQRAVVLPMAKPGQTQLAGFVVAAVSPRLAFNDDYQGFMDLLAGHVATAVANARAYEEEKRRAEALAELDRAKTAFFSNVSHEFRTPLTLMLGPVEDLLARSHTDLSPAAAGQLEVVNRNGLRLLRLVNTLLDFSRIEAGRVRAAYQPTDLAAFTAELASNFRAACERAGLRLAVDCPPLTEPAFVDREMWEKVVLNLLSNAFKFTFEGEIAVSLRQVPSPRNGEEGGMVELRVRDTGTGIPAEEVPRLFERFHRVRNARGRTHEGSGIGLALVQELVRLHGGSVRAESALGRGSTFTVAVPLGSAHLPPDRIGADRTLASTATGAGPYVEEALRWLPEEANGRPELPTYPEMLPVPAFPSEHTNGDDRPRVLVADDNADMRQYVARLLAERYQVEAAADGAAALAAARGRPPDLVLTDIMMPRLDGFGLLQELRADERTRSLPVILLSARAGEESRVEGLEAGADDYVIKPFSARELLARVDAHLKMARMRREATEALRESEARYRTVVNQAATGVVEADAAGRMTLVNRRWCEMLGYSEAELLQMTIADVTDPDNLAPTLDAVRRLAEGGPDFMIEKCYRRKDGSTLWASSSVSALRGPAGEYRGLVAVVLDITDRKRAEQTLRTAAESDRFRARLADALRPLLDPVEIQAMATRVLGEHLRANRVFYGEIEANEHVVVARDYTREVPSFAGRHRLDDFGPALIAECRAGRTLIITNAATETRVNDEERARIIAISSHAAVAVPLIKAGRWVAVLAVQQAELRAWTSEEVALIEETAERSWAAVERVRAEQATRQAQEQVQFVSDAVPALIAYVDRDCRYRMVNQAYEVWFGHPRSGVVGKHLRDVLGETVWEVIRPHVEIALSGRPDAYEAFAAYKDGRPRWISVAYTPDADGGGAVRGFVSLVNDITQRKQMEETLKEADRKKDEFLATLAHELRNPLAPLRNGLQLLKLAGGDAEAVEQSRAMMERQLGQLVRLIDDLLDVSRISRGKVALRRERVELAQAVRQAVETSGPLVEGGSHQLTVRLPPRPVYLDADPLRLAQVFSNLLNNACKFTPPGGRIGLTAERRGRDVVVSVRDTGIGIPPDKIGGIFEMFAQVDRALERSQGGLGIGLSLVKGLVELHGGSVTATSGGPGRGSEFVVRLPVAGEGSQLPPEGPAEEPAAAGRRRILVVDDNRDSADSLALLLKLKGHEAHTAYDGREAVEAARRLRPEVILLDLGMPKLNGYEACCRIREQPGGGDVVILALTGWGQEEDRRRSREAGFNGHLVKPVDYATLMELLAGLQTATT